MFVSTGANASYPHDVIFVIPTKNTEELFVSILGRLMTHPQITGKTLFRINRNKFSMFHLTESIAFLPFETFSKNHPRKVSLQIEDFLELLESTTSCNETIPSPTSWNPFSFKAGFLFFLLRIKMNKNSSKDQQNSFDCRRNERLDERALQRK